MKIVVIGTGSIGSFVGGHLRKKGMDIRFLARPAMQQALKANGLHLTDIDGGEHHLAAENLQFVDTANVGADIKQADCIIVAVKSRHTEDVAHQIKQFAHKDCIILSFQNGLRNKDRLQSVLAPDQDIRRVVVPWNVVEKAPGHFHRGTGGHLMLEAGPSALVDLFAGAGLVTEERKDMDNILWGKLLLNLNNALNALSNLPLKQELMDPAWRKLLAASQEETLAVLQALDIEPVAALPLPPKRLPLVLRLPTFLYKVIASANLKMDDEARSSMWEDLVKSRPTEIDDLQGEVIERAKALNIPTPILCRTLDLVRDAEKRAPALQNISPADFYRSG